MSAGWPVQGYRSASARSYGDGLSDGSLEASAAAAGAGGAAAGFASPSDAWAKVLGQSARLRAARSAGMAALKNAPYVRWFAATWALYETTTMYYGTGSHPALPRLGNCLNTPPAISAGPLPGGPSTWPAGCGTTETEGPVPIPGMPALGVDPVTGRGCWVWNTSYSALYPKTGLPPTNQWISGVVFGGIQAGAAQMGWTWYAKPLWKVPKPEFHPAIAPEALPMVQPMPMPLADPLPYRLLPYRVPNPNRSPTERPQRGHARGLPRPRPWLEPSPFVPPPPPPRWPRIPDVTITGQGATVGPPQHKWKDPGKKEKKANVWRLGSTGVGKVFNKVTETGDAIDAIWNALPDKFKKREMAKRHGKPPKMLDKLGQIVGNWDQIDAGEAVGNLIENEVKDRAIGAVGKQLQKPGKAMGSNRGLGGGPWSKAGKFFRV